MVSEAPKKEPQQGSPEQLLQIAIKAAPDWSNDWRIIGFAINCLILLNPWVSGWLRTLVQYVGVPTVSEIQALADPTKPDALDWVAPEFSATPEVGDKIAGYEVTSGFGPREAPVAGASTDHKGIDLGTPTGVALRMVGNGTVECFNEGEGVGYGIYAVLNTTVKGQQKEFLLGHLSECADGTFKNSEIIARTGNTGNSSGAHLHFEQIENGSPVPPQSGYLWWVIMGKEPEPLLERNKDGW